MNFGILGLGRVIEKRVFNVFQKELKNSKVVCVFDKDKRKNNVYAKKFNCDVTNNIKSFLKTDCDYIYIATESGNHYQNIKECFKYNKSVVVEKPPVLKLNQLIELNKISKKKKLEFYVIYQNRLNKSVQYMKKYLNGKNSKIIFSTLNLSWSRNQNYYSDWHGSWKLDGGVASQQGIHYIDILCYLFGNPVKCISNISKKSNKLEAEDTHSSLIVFKNNVSCTANFTTALRPQDYEASIKVIMRDEIWSLDGLCCNKINYYDLENKNNKKNNLCKKNSEKVKNGYGNSHTKSFQAIIDYKLQKSKEEPLKSIDTINTLKLLNMMYKSFEVNRWVYFKERNLVSKLGK